MLDITVDKTIKKVFVNREFAAERNLVWDVTTKQEILGQWWAPKPWISRTKYTDFKVGGRRFYAMCGPDREEHLAVQDFTAISPKTNLKIKEISFQG
ncbi:SRPBCC domain-containing protein [Olivibacter sp. SDN3]|uniref:SRPBCC domain-containing protein n=1 Tax=Olivibacter sp. SDN3 TaxID=2764720 RepID=UPI001C9E67F0|nr:SRPBCC domain-containing protein [Olivibacter sp. SDN3]